MERKDIKNNIDVSIIISSYNSNDLLANCLSSLITHTANINYEIIIIDNASKAENTEKVIKLYPGIIFIQNTENRGFGTANNQGLEIAKGKYVLFLNNDTIFFENVIKKVYDFAESMSDSLIIGCKLLNQDHSLQRSTYDFPSLRNVFTSNFFLYLLFPKSKYFNKYHLINQKINQISEVDVITGAFLFCTKNSFKKIGGFDERFFFYNEDTDLCYRFKKYGGKIFYYPATSLIHLKGGTAKVTSWFSIKYQSISTIKFFQKHFRGIVLFLLIVTHYTGLLLRIPLSFIAGIVTLNINLMKRALFNIKLLFIYPKNVFK